MKEGSSITIQWSDWTMNRRDAGDGDEDALRCVVCV